MHENPINRYGENNIKLINVLVGSLTCLVVVTSFLLMYMWYNKRKDIKNDAFDVVNIYLNENSQKTKQANNNEDKTETLNEIVKNETTENKQTIIDTNSHIERPSKTAMSFLSNNSQKFNLSIKSFNDSIKETAKVLSAEALDSKIIKQIKCIDSKDSGVSKDVNEIITKKDSTKLLYSSSEISNDFKKVEARELSRSPYTSRTNTRVIDIRPIISNNSLNLFNFSENDADNIDYDDYFSRHLSSNLSLKTGVILEPMLYAKRIYQNVEPIHSEIHELKDSKLCNVLNIKIEPQNYIGDIMKIDSSTTIGSEQISRLSNSVSDKSELSRSQINVQDDDFVRKLSSIYFNKNIPNLNLYYPDLSNDKNYESIKLSIQQYRIKQKQKNENDIIKHNEYDVFNNLLNKQSVEHDVLSSKFPSLANFEIMQFSNEISNKNYFDKISSSDNDNLADFKNVEYRNTSESGGSTKTNSEFELDNRNGVFSNELLPCCDSINLNSIVEIDQEQHSLSNKSSTESSIYDETNKTPFEMPYGNVESSHLIEIQSNCSFFNTDNMDIPNEVMKSNSNFESLSLYSNGTLTPDYKSYSNLTSLEDDEKMNDSINKNYSDNNISNELETEKTRASKDIIKFKRAPLNTEEITLDNKWKVKQYERNKRFRRISNNELTSSDETIYLQSGSLKSESSSYKHVPILANIDEESTLASNNKPSLKVVEMKRKSKDYLITEMYQEPL